MLIITAIAIAVTAVATAGVGALATSTSFGSAFSSLLGGTFASLGAGVAGATAITSVGVVAAATVGAAVGSIVSQGIGVATGLQDKFSFKGVAIAAIAGGIGAGLGGVNIKGLDKFGNALARGAIGNVATQGVGIATGLQSRFNWAGLASNVASAGIGSKVGGWTGENRLLTGGAVGVGSSAVESLVTGRNFGDTLRANLPGIIANTIGNLAAEEISLRQEARAGARTFVEKAAELKGLTPGTPEYNSFIDQNRGTVRSLSHDIAKVQRSGDGGALISVRDQYAEQLLGESFYQGQALLAPLDDQILVYGKKPEAAIHSLIDPIDMEAGNLAIRASAIGNQAIDSIPGGRFAVGLLDLGLTIAGGPARAALGAVVGKVSEEATGRLTSRFQEVGYVERDAAAGGVGGPFLLTIATKGVGSALAMGGIFGGIRNAHLAGGNHPKNRCALRQ